MSGCETIYFTPSLSHSANVLLINQHVFYSFCFVGFRVNPVVVIIQHQDMVLLGLTLVLLRGTILQELHHNMEAIHHQLDSIRHSQDTIHHQDKLHLEHIHLKILDILLKQVRDLDILKRGLRFGWHLL